MASLTEVNSVNLLSEREINSKSCISFERKMHSSYSMINRLGLETELEVIIIIIIVTLIIMLIIFDVGSLGMCQLSGVE